MKPPFRIRSLCVRRSAACQDRGGQAHALARVGQDGGHPRDPLASQPSCSVIWRPSPPANRLWGRPPTVPPLPEDADFVFAEGLRLHWYPLALGRYAVQGLGFARARPDLAPMEASAGGAPGYNRTTFSTSVPRVMPRRSTTRRSCVRTVSWSAPGRAVRISARSSSCNASSKGTLERPWSGGVGTCGSW